MAEEENLQLKKDTKIAFNEPPSGVEDEKREEVPRRFPLPEGDELIGQSNLFHVVKPKETLMELAREYGLGFNEISLANPTINPWIPKPGTVINASLVRILPGLNRPADIIVNIPEMRLYYRQSNGWVETYPVGVGRVGYSTPEGGATLVRKRASPSWYVPQSIKEEKPELPDVVPPGPENPLGTHALYLSMAGYLLHGTNEPLGIGRRVSHGCIRLYPKDIITFFESAKIGSQVRLVHEPVKAGWRGRELFIEVHPPFEEEVAQKESQEKLRHLATVAVGQALDRRPDWVVEMDWSEVDRHVGRPDGMAHPVGQVLLSDERE
ncbi:MAG: L,D-transpeptidase family protein [Magnetococcales bacterium]|nr:L,D-transpeptidase family protein [Magnetococcales bacterium]